MARSTRSSSATPDRPWQVDLDFAQVPTTSGVYLLLGEGDELLYVGKAKNLRVRLRSYARVGAQDGARSVRLVSATRRVRWEECGTEARAIARETDLLRALRPPFNFTHAARSEYLSIAIADRGAKLSLRLGDGTSSPGEVMYGCFPFEARTPDVFPALVGALYLAQPGPTRSPMPSRPRRGAGYEIVVADDLRPSLRKYLGGRSPQLVPELERRIRARDHDVLALRSLADDLVALRTFYELGPRALRRLQLSQRAPIGPVTAAMLGALFAARFEAEIAATVPVDLDAVEGRIVELHDQGMRFRAIAALLNRERLPARRGGGRWHAGDVAAVVGEHIARATRSPQTRS